jgi:hypothetical protein
LSSIEAFTVFSLKTIVVASGVSMLAMSCIVDLRSDTTPCGGSAMRSNVAFTSADVSDDPSWNVTPSCSLKV